MSREWYYPESGTHSEPEGANVSVGIDWQPSYSDTSVTTNLKIYRWDRYNTDNDASDFWEYMDEPDGSRGSWGWLTWGSGSGTREVDSFATRTYSKKHSEYSVNCKLEWRKLGTWYYHQGVHRIGDDYANWYLTIPALQSYTVTYHLNGGTGNLPTNDINWHGEHYYISKIIPVKPGYEFLGWSRTQVWNGTDHLYHPNFTSDGYDWTGVNNNLNFYAQWKCVKKYTVHFDLQGGQGNIPDINTLIDIDATIPDIIPTKENYIFAFWSTSLNDEGIQYYPNNKIKNHTDTILYAIWVRDIDVLIAYQQSIPKQILIPNNAKEIYVNI